MLKDSLLWLYWFPFRFLLQRVPTSWTRLLGRTLAALAYRGLRGKRRRLEVEFDAALAHCLPESTRRDAVVRDTFRILIQNDLEMLLYPVMNARNISRFIGCEGLENLQKALTAGKGVLLAFGHFGANQMIMPALGYRGFVFNQLSAPATVWQEKRPDKTFSRMEQLALQRRWAHECSLPVRHINIFGSLKEAFRCLKRNEVLGVAIDGGGGEDRCDVPFLNRAGVFSTGALDIALRVGASILPAFVVRDARGHNTLVIEPPLKTETAASGPVEPKEALGQFAARLDDYVRRYPSHYLDFLALRAFMAKVDGHAFLLP